MSDHWDVISLRGLSAVGSHGVYDFERNGSQVFTADLKLYIDARKAAETDDVAFTVDYGQLAEKAVEILSGTPVYLLETLAGHLAEMALEFPLVHRVEVTVHKPMAPVRHQFEDVSVRVIRSRQHVQAGSAAETPDVEPEPKPTSELVGERNATDFSDAPVQIQAAEKPAPPPPSQRDERRAEPRRAPLFSLPPVSTPTIAKRQGDTEDRKGYADTLRVTNANLIRRSFDDGSPVYDFVLALGSNKGDSLTILAGAVKAIRATDGVQIQKVSPVVRTLPVLEKGMLPQPDYLNVVLVGRTVLPPPILLEEMNRIEAEFGRVRGRRWSSRTLDIDIINFDGMRLQTRDLTLPHPRAHQRAFVLLPWSLISPNAKLPVHGAIKDLLEVAPDASGMLAVRENWLGDDDELQDSSEILLLDRPERPKITVDPTMPTVQVRGEKLHLAPIQDDPIFKSLLSREDQTPKSTPAQQPPPAVGPAQVARPATPSAVSKPQTAQKTASAATAPSGPGAVQNKQAPTRTGLPDWRAAAAAKTPKVVDDQPERARPESVPTTTGSIATGRRVTVRPTPTGTVPVTGGHR